MSVTFSQARRIGRLTTALGPDTLSMLRFDGHDHVNELFEYRIDALSTQADIDFDALIGTHATAEIEAHDVMRPFDGIVTFARWAGVGENGHRYELTIRPWFWLAGRRRNQRIFHNKTVVDILKELLADYAPLGNPALELALTKDYPVLEYTVQYRESDLDFARRQMERHAISFHFRHEVGSHTMVLTDDVLTHREIGPRPFKQYDGHHQYESEHFWDWAPERSLTTGAIRLTDYDFKRPTQKMEVERPGDAQHAQGQIEAFDYPGDYLDQGTGRTVAGLRIDQERGGDRRMRAAGDCVSLNSGLRLTLSGDPAPGTGEGYLCLSASHHFDAEAYGSGTAGEQYAFSGAYVLMPDTAPMASPRRTPVARVHGPQTAEVVGEGEIDCDEYGRILVRFHWDLKGAHSMRCRVSQSWAGAGWGGMVIPRIGMEVVVEFLEGDPDKPLVTGCVYNGKNAAPYPLPDHKTKAVWRSDTHQGQGYNEISLEDRAGAETMFFHAQKDMATKVLNNQSSNVLANRTDAVGGNASTRIGQNAIERVGANKTVSIGGGAGGAGLMAMLGPLIQASGRFFTRGANEAGAGSPVTSLSSGLAGLEEAPPEVAALSQEAEFAASGAHRAEAGRMQAEAGGLMGKLMGMIMPSSGSLSTTVEKYRQDTTGIAASEQVGVAKNTLVGLTMLTSVGKLKKVLVGEDYQLEARRSIFNRTAKHTLQARERFVIGGPGGTIIIDETGITLKARRVQIRSPQVQIMAGAPDQVEALSTDKAFVQQCKDAPGGSGGGAAGT